jgi:flagella basal body P-ring formation protein FlgA
MMKKWFETIWYMQIVLTATVATSAAEESQSDKVDIRLWPEVTITHAEIRLGEMATITGTGDHLEAIRRFWISNKLVENEPLVVRAWDISRRLAEAGFDSASVKITGAARCEVNYVLPKDEKNDAVKKSDDAVSITRAARLAGPATLETNIRELICKQLSGKNLVKEAKIIINFNPVLQELLALTEPPYHFVVEPQQRDTNWMGLVGLNVNIYRENKLVRKISMLVQVQIQIPVVIATTSINSKAKITRDDIKTVWKEISQFNMKSITSQETIVDSQAKRMIPIGATITNDMIESIPLVRRNQMVTVLYHKGGLEIKLVGKSMDNAGRNEMVKVRNERSKEIFHARVVDAGTVTVENDIAEPALTVAETTGGNL